MVLEHSPIAFPQPRTKPKVDLSPTHFNHILELYLSILDSEEVYLIVIFELLNLLFPSIN
jgi:hypothetical protein